MKIESDMIPDKIYIPKNLAPHLTEEWASHTHGSLDEYIRKDALLEWIESEMVRLWELLPDANNPNPTQMELRYLGQYMQMEALEDKLNSI